MSRFFSIFALVLGLAGSALAQEFSGLARIDAEASRIMAAGRDGVRVELTLSQGVPYRLFTLDNPPRLVLDFQEVDWTGLSARDLLQTDRIAQAQFGTYVPGWSRMVLDLGQPLGVEQAELRVDPVTGAAVLRLQMQPVGAEEFAAAAGAPKDPRWDLPEPAQVVAPAPRGPDALLRVVLDPGHGGIDPGAETGVSDEKTLMLTFARELRELLLRSGGFEVELTRDGDHFVSLERRITLAHRAGADVFISLHADSLSEGLAHGAAVYVLSKDASDIASAKLAERHDRGDLLAGVDLSATDDQVADVLLDLARQETRPRTRALAGALAQGMAQQGGPMNRRPVREASFSVLKAADIPSVLIELGFLSSPRDLKNIRTPEWRAAMAQGIRNGLQNWRDADRAKQPLVRN
ncbi:N-acetylmuramoyl-L-alanine amidase [Ruegeria sp. HKCCD8929]|uniref:N-acetylmuramoyl-L-alanine amidase n=1 Tax=Ruegeria sp. HKCCD8929 TaxID=2683006 RepID=UPI001489DC18|nr:N-acetylmuramoyl-L-alanine amidase [Ruegeria sp. HKCCD8929]